MYTCEHPSPSVAPWRPAEPLFLHSIRDWTCTPIRHAPRVQVAPTQSLAFPALVVRLAHHSSPDQLPEMRWGMCSEERRDGVNAASEPILVRPGWPGTSPSPPLPQSPMGGTLRPKNSGSLTRPDDMLLPAPSLIYYVTSGKHLPISGPWFPKDTAQSLL